MPMKATLENRLLSSTANNGRPRLRKLVKLDLGCGNNLQSGFTGVDLTKKDTQATIEHNLLTYPWPFEDNSVDETFCSHFIEHIPHGNSFRDGLFEFMDELWRILKPDGIARFVSPYYTSVRAWQDPTHQRAISEPMFLYFNAEWRKLNKLEHYPVKANFKMESVNHAISEEFTGRAQEAVQYAAMHYWNVAMDIVVVLKKLEK